MVRVHLAAECDINSTSTNGAWSDIEVMVAWCSLSIASFPGSQAFPPSSSWSLAELQFCKQTILQVIKNWTVGRPGNEATLSNGYMISMSWNILLMLSWNYLLDLSQRSAAWASCNFLNEHSRTLLIGIPKPNSRCSSLPSVSEVPYMEGFIYLQAEVAHCSWKDCTELTWNECGFNQRMFTCFLKQKMHLV